MAAALPGIVQVQRITIGESLAPLLPGYKRYFDVFLSQLDDAKPTETVDNPFLVGMVGQASNQFALEAIDALNEGITSLQQAIQNKRAYRKTTYIANWVYSIFDWMSWGAVARAEKELHRVIREVFQAALKPNSHMKNAIPSFLNALQPTYLQLYKDDPLFKEIGKIEAVQKVLCKKGVEKPDFVGLLRDCISDVPEKKEAFKKNLLWVLEGNYDNLANLPKIEQDGRNLNVFQFMLQLPSPDLAEWMLDNILPNCSQKVQESFLLQYYSTVGFPTAVEMLAKHLNFWVQKAENLGTPYIVIKIRTAVTSLLLTKLVYHINRLIYPNDSKEQEGVVYYCLGTGESLPNAEDKEKFLEALLK